MIRKWQTVSALILGLGVVFAAHAANTVTVGVLAPLSGFAAASGKSAVTSIKLAAKTINQHGGLQGQPIVLKIYDDQADPKQAINFARRLVGHDHARLVIAASYSGASLAAAPIFNKNHVPTMVAYAVAPDVTSGHPYVFRVGLMGRVEGRLGPMLVRKLGAKNAAMINLKNDFGQALEQGFKHRAKKYSLPIVFSDTYALGNKNFTSTLVRLKTHHPGAIYASGYYEDTASLVRQAQSLGIRAPIIGQDGYDSFKFTELAGAAGNGVYITTQLDRDSKHADVQHFLKAYKAATGDPADMVGATAYAALEVMGKAVAKAESLDAAAVKKTLAHMKNVDTVAGHIYRWNENGDPIKTATVQVVRNGEFHRYMNVTDRKLLTP